MTPSHVRQNAIFNNFPASQHRDSPAGNVPQEPAGGVFRNQEDRKMMLAFHGAGVSAEIEIALQRQFSGSLTADITDNAEMFEKQ